ncbi:MAG: DUF2798 domain-containing protein [Burkholderiales bacterium]|nr:DUF2798 domain-containing protein [Burkholderiales bacterium]
MSKSPPSVARSSWKLPKPLMPYVFAFYMAAIMALLMCAVIVAANSGIGPRYLAQVLEAYTLAMPLAFVCVIIVRPLVARLVHHTVQT